LCIVILDPQINDLDWLSPKNVVVIPNGIEDNFVFEAKNKQNIYFNILYIGLLIPFKGIENAINASKILKERGVKFKWTFIGGWSSIDFKDHILKMIETFNLSDYVEFVGEKIENERWQYFKEADVLCHPTENDLMPLCIIEGMMMSLPIVTSDLRTLKCIVDEKQNGLIFPAKNFEKLADSLEYLHNNREEAIKMGENGRAKFKKLYSIEKHLEAVKSAIYKLY
jgi:glycosyltransferase involved in cell wall biosynthesis